MGNKGTKASKAQGYDKFDPGKPVYSTVPPGICQFDENFKPSKLLSRKKISPDTYVYTFQTPDETKPLNLSTCACLLAKGPQEETKEGEEPKFVIRPYTPCSTNAMVGKFEFLIKTYEEGKMTKWLEQLEIGDKVEFKHIDFNVKLQYPFNKKFVGMIVGGSGITPMIQALNALLGNPDDEARVKILFSNKTSDDILAKSTLDTWQKKHPQLEIEYFLTREPAESKSGATRGRITEDVIRNSFPEPSDDMIIFLCGPPPMYESFCGPRNEKVVKENSILGKLGYNEAQVYKF